MLRVFFLLSFVVSMAVMAFDVKTISVTDDKNSYDVYDGDILFTNQDKIQFTFSSKKDTTIKINSIYKNSINNMKTIELKKDEIAKFPEEDFINFDQEGDVKFEFKDATTTQILHLKYVKNKPKKITQINEDSKYALNINEIIGNSRGVKEKEAYSHLVKSTVVVETPDEIGSGVVISKDGKILTNYHVVKNQESANIAFKPNSKYATNPSKNSFYKAKVAKVDPIKDLALLELLDAQTVKNTIPILFAQHQNIQEGEDIYLMGHPQKEYFTFDYGVVGAIRENYSWNSHKANYVIQTKTSISKGNSGGPLLGEDYKLIGLNSFSNTQGQNLNFAVSIYDINQFLSKKDNRTFSLKIENQYKNYTKLSVKSGFDTQNRPVTAYELDSNRNNIKDLLAIDVGDDGVYNYLLFDSDEDGNYEKKAYDKDGDGIIERVVVY